MGLFSKKKEARAAEVATQTSEDKILRGLLSSANEMSVEKAMNIPAIAGSVNFIANIIAMLPIKLYEENADHTETKEIRDDIRLKLLNEDTNDLLSAYQMKRALIRDYLLSGGGYVYVRRYGNKVVSLNYVDNAVVSVTKNADPIKKDARLLVGGGAYFPYEFIIMARNTKDGVTGTGVVAENPEMLTGIYNMIVFEKQLVRNGGSRKGFLESERKLAKEEMDLLREKWEELYSDYSNGVMILNNGIKFVQASSSSVEMQLNENKQTNSRLIYGLFNLSEQVVTGTAGDEENSSAVKVAIVPIIKELEEAVNRACLLEDEKEHKYFACDTTELLKGDILKRYQAYQVGLNANFLQPDEVRYKEDLPSLGLDFIKLGLNDVLYNPKTKEVYTPNTNQTTNIDEKNSGNVLQNGTEDDIIQTRKYIQDPKTGKMMGSTSDSNGGTLEPSPTGANELKVKGFADKHKLNNHWKNGRTHKNEYIPDGIVTSEQYERRAVELLESPVGGNILGHLDKENFIIRYDKTNNDFVKGDIEKGVFTMFKPINGYVYYEKQRMEDIKHGGKA